MIVDDLNVFGASVRPTETHPELIIYADAVLPGPIPSQGFQPVTWGHTQVVQSSGNLQLPQLAACDAGNMSKSFNPFAPGNSLCIEALERLDHSDMIMYCVINVKRDGCRPAGCRSSVPISAVGGV
jgi:hypothetical protein